MSDDQSDDVRRELLALRADYVTVFDSVPGRRVFRDIIRECEFLSPTLQPGDAISTAWADGRRSIVLLLFARLRWTETSLMRMALAREDANFSPVGSDHDPADDELMNLFSVGGGL